MGLKCAECGGDMVGSGYRVLFATCNECGKSFHVDECIEK